MAKRLLGVALWALPIAGAFLILYLYLGNNTVSNSSGNRQQTGGEEMSTLLASVLSVSITPQTQADKIRSEGFANNSFFADILGVNKSGNKLSLGINLPSEKSFDTKKTTSLVQCGPDKTNVISSTNLALLKEKVNLIKNAQVGDFLWAYCLNDSCSIIGRECVLVKRE